MLVLAYRLVIFTKKVKLRSKEVQVYMAIKIRDYGIQRNIFAMLEVSIVLKN
jgi:hypothetical protein